MSANRPDGWILDKSGARVCEFVAARTPLDRMIGLIGKPPLKAGKAMLFKTRRVHSIGMRRAIDVVYLSEQFDVLGVRRLDPGRLGPSIRGTKWILELEAGEAERLGLRAGGSHRIEEASN